ncbi:NADPH dehydrogenase [Echria macrotheca]|uniref:NADPH dehydrogenase n=1 Tax=Echria macrotheca TaxID=438768 RepID=A0AAJ0BD45_9PEZI|nr:NADPH dehydrogenase [Echria macrotheca]
MSYKPSLHAPGVPYFTPIQSPPAGTPLPSSSSPSKTPTLFTPLTLRSLTLPNRFIVSPMCTYSSPTTGHLTDWHLVHLGALAQRGAALTIFEATAVTPNGRITPADAGIWDDSHIPPLRRVVDFIHGQGQKAGIQLAHAGRKASNLSPHDPLYVRDKNDLATEKDGGWPADVVAPSAVAYSDTFAMPRGLSVEEIKGLVGSFAQAARRAVEAGFDTVEIHAAHGYLISEFLSPITNKRTDEYGGSFTNRTRFLLEIITAVRAVIPDSMPLLVRISATEWMGHLFAPQKSWDLEQSIRLALILANSGVDLLDVSSGGNMPSQQINMYPRYQIDLAGKIRDALREAGKGKNTAMLVGAVGLVTTPEIARDVVQEDDENDGTKAPADVVFVARQFLREPEFVLRAADKLGVKVRWPVQYLRAATGF